MVLVPLYDDNHLKFIPFQATTWILIAINFAVFIWQQTFTSEALDLFAVHAGVIPASLVGGGGTLPVELQQMQPELTLITYMFLHGDIWHLLGNMLVLWMVGSLMEAEWGSRRFLELYFFSVVGGALVTMAAAYAHVFGSSPETLVIGASGGALGLLIALAVVDGDREFTLLLAFIIPITMRVKYLVAIIVLGVFVATMLPSGDRVANFAHVGGLLFGFLYAKFIPRRGLGFEASEKYYGVRNEWQRWKRRQAAKNRCWANHLVGM